MIQATTPRSPATVDAFPSGGQRGDGWRARLELGFVPGPGRTVLRHRRHYGPLRVQRTFHPEGDPCHSYLLHPPGGVVGGDTIEIDVSTAAGAHALLTTPAAGKFYRSAGDTACQRQHFRVGDGAALEWLPALNILHAGARAALHSRFDIAPGGRLLAWDLLGLGRPGSGDHFERGSCDLALEVDVGEHSLLRERLRLEGGETLLQAPWGLQGRHYLATLIAAPGTSAMLDALRDQAAGERPDPVMGCTLLRRGTIADAQEGGLLVCRWLAHSGEALWEAMIRAWFLLRPLVMGRPASAPRIWAT